MLIKGAYPAESITLAVSVHHPVYWNTRILAKTKENFLGIDKIG